MGTVVDQLTSPFSTASEYSNILQEVEVPIMDDRRCGAMLRGMNLPPLGRDMLCASFPDGEKDACQVISIVIVSQLPSHVQLFVTLWTAAH